MRRLAKGLAMTSLGLALIPATAGAVVTVGSTLTASHSGVVSTGADAVYVNTALAGAAFPTGSPVSGTVIRWRLRGVSPSGMTNTFNIRILRPAGAGTFTGVGTGAPQTLFNGFDDLTRTFDTALPIHAGDQIGLAATNSAGTPTGGGAGDSFENFSDFADGSSSGNSLGTFASQQVLFNADVEPTNVFSLSAPQPDKKRGTATIVVTLPNAGSLQVQGTAIQPQTLTSSVEGQQTASLLPTGPTRKRLKRKGKASGSATFTYTPSFGTATTQTVTFALRKKHKKKR
jgi:hypothetical protein